MNETIVLTTFSSSSFIIWCFFHLSYNVTWKTYCPYLQINFRYSH